MIGNNGIKTLVNIVLPIQPGEQLQRETDPMLIRCFDVTVTLRIALNLALLRISLLAVNMIYCINLWCLFQCLTIYSTTL